MRDLTLEINEYFACCKIDVICNFPYITGKHLTDDDWLFSLSRFPGDNLNNNLITFAHSSRQNKGVCTPRLFAKWLREQGEDVKELKYKHITLYTCCLSRKFWKNYNNYIKNSESSESSDI